MYFLTKTDAKASQVTPKVTEFLPLFLTTKEEKPADFLLSKNTTDKTSEGHKATTDVDFVKFKNTK